MNAPFRYFLNDLTDAYEHGGKVSRELGVEPEQGNLERSLAALVKLFKTARETSGSVYLMVGVNGPIYELRYQKNPDGIEGKINGEEDVQPNYSR